MEEEEEPPVPRSERRRQRRIGAAFDQCPCHDTNEYSARDTYEK